MTERFALPRTSSSLPARWCRSMSRLLSCARATQSAFLSDLLGRGTEHSCSTRSASARPALSRTRPMLIGLLALHLAVGAGLLSAARRIGRWGLVIGGIAPLATVAWVATRAGQILDGEAVVEDT